jgi:hypothetical protein
MESAQTGIGTIYILAPGHSGSTLLNLMLGSHPQACAVSELTYLPANVVQGETCTCGESIHTCAHWRNVAKALQPKLGFDVLAQPRRLDLGYIDAPKGPYKARATYRALWKVRRVAAYGALVSPLPLPGLLTRRFDKGIDNRLALYDAIREASGASVVVDSSKEYLHGYAVYARQPDRTRLILLTRDGRAVFNSNLRRGFDRDYALRVWRNYYRFALLALGRAVDPAHVLTVRYEDLVTDPKATLATASRFSGLEPVPAMFDTHSKTHHITSGNNMRFQAGAELRLDTRWHRELSAANRDFFERNAGMLNRRLGYQ